MLARARALLLSVTMAMGMMASVHAAKAEDRAPASSPITVTEAWARATPGGVTIGAAYLTLNASQADTLIKVTSPVSDRVEVHTSLGDDGMMKMRRLEDLPLAAGETHKLAPGGDHIMLIGLKTPLVEGEKLPLTLTFDKAGQITVEAEIAPVGAPGPVKK